MKPSEIIQQIYYLNKEINTLIAQLVSDKENPQIMDIDLLNQKLISIYDLSLKLRYQLNLGEVEIASEETDLEYFHFEPGTSRFMIEKEEPVAVEGNIEEHTEDIPEEKEIETPQIKELPKVESTINEPELVEEIVVEPMEEHATEPIEETETIKEEKVIAEEPEVDQTELPEPAFDPIEEVKEHAVSEEIIPETNQNETPYWSVETGWINKPVENIVETVEEIKRPEVVEETAPEPEQIQNQKKTVEAELKTEPKEKKPIFESISKHERSLNEMMAENKDKSVISEAQNLAFTDFKSAITLNLKISFIRELFHGNEKDYKKMIDFLTKCENYSEARLYMQGEKEKHPEWLDKQDLINHLQELINRKFL